jgi:hypothetical protein
MFRTFSIRPHRNVDVVLNRIKYGVGIKTCRLHYRIDAHDIKTVFITRVIHKECVFYKSNKVRTMIAMSIDQFSPAH